MSTLALLDRAARALAKCDLDEAKSIRDKAQALEVYARQAKQSAAMERQCVTIRLRAERRIGELLTGRVKPGNPQWSHGATIGLGKLGITKSQSSRWQTAATLPEADFERYLVSKGELSTTAILKLVKDRERAQQTGPASGGNILTGPATRLWDKLEDDSVDLFLTDPPYADTERYGELAELAAAKLKPGGLCLAYAGVGYLPAVLEAMAQYLAYWWTICIEFSGPHRAIYPRKIQSKWVPVVAFCRGKNATGWFTDHLHGGGREKDLHEWQHGQSEAEYLVEKLTEPGALVVDPYCGSGTIPAACKKLGRRWLACEVNSGTARTARRRIAA